MAQHFYLPQPAPTHHVFIGATSDDGHPAVFRLQIDAASGELRHTGGLAGVAEMVAVVPEKAGSGENSMVGSPW